MQLLHQILSVQYSDLFMTSEPRRQRFLEKKLFLNAGRGDEEIGCSKLKLYIITLSTLPKNISPQEGLNILSYV